MQVKVECGVKERKNYDHAKQPACPAEKAKVIPGTLKFFGMIGAIE